MTTQTKDIIIKFDYYGEQTVGEIKKITGLVKARHLVPMIDNLNLEANPRASKTGSVTDAIQESIEDSSGIFPFMTKGILLASSCYEKRERNRIRIAPEDATLEGILDGGHNTLAIGLYILKLALEREGNTLRGKSKTWDEFKLIWKDNHSSIDNLLKHLRNNLEDKSLNFYVPVELLVPRDPNNYESIEVFRDSLFSICEARNNNVQLAVSDKANQLGYFEDLKKLFDRYEPELSKKIIWKSNDGGEIKAQDIIALTWIPLSLVSPVSDDGTGKNIIEPVQPNKIYGGKGACLKQFERFMASPNVTSAISGAKRELKNNEVVSAFRVAVDIPALYDYIFENFPDLYNGAGGSYGRITAVKTLNEKYTNKRTPFGNKEIDTLSPEGYIAPLIYGLQAIMERREENGRYEISWKCPPLSFLEKKLPDIVQKYCGIIQTCGFDPQKVGKNAYNYSVAIDAYKMAFAGVI